MRIVDIGICVNNKDPKGLGRIRYKSYGVINSSVEQSVNFEEWDENDQLTAIPFLPSHINVIPQVRQSVKLIKYDTEKNNQNIEYIAGPFSTPHDFTEETFTSQHKYTTFGGIIVKSLPDLKDENGTYIDKKSENSLPKLDDFGIKGNYGSDVIFTENGLILNGGKLITKETPNKSNRKRLQEVPLVSKKSSKLILKKFPTKMKIIEKDDIKEEMIVSKINYILEYEINDLLNPTKLNIFVVKVLNNHGSKFDTNVFNYTTKIDYLDTNVFKLINEDNSISGVTFEINVDSINSAKSELRNVLHIINNKSLYDLNNLYISEKLHPLYFRPTENFNLLKPQNDIEKINKGDFLDSYKVGNIKQSHGLLFSKESIDPPIKEIPIKNKILKKVNENVEQSFGSITTDNLFLLSTDTNKGSKSLINFEELSNYEYSQEDFLGKISDGTYSIVRGEELIKLLKLMYNFMRGHVHNINEPGIFLEEIENELSSSINRMSNNLINKSIRIN